MALNYKNLNPDGEDFELLCRDVLESIGAKIVSEPTRGPDQKKDLIIEVESQDPLGNKSTLKYLVQCKHKAHSGKSVYENEIGDFRSACLVHKTHGYFLITSTIASTTVATNLNAENERGHLKTIIWDGRKLEEKIESSPKSAQITATYNLKERIDITYDELKRILLGEYHLPFTFEHEVLENDLKGLIFKAEHLDDQYKKKVELSGYFCTDSTIDDEYIDNLKNKYELDSCEFFAGESNKANVTALADLYERLQNYRDTYYQECLWKTLSFSPINPTMIRMIESSITSMPYKPQEVTNYWLTRLINEDVNQVDIFIIMQACQAAVNLKIYSALDAIKNQLSHSDDWSLSEDNTSALAQSLVGALMELDQGEQASIKQVMAIFKAIKNKQVLAEIIRYFCHFSVQDEDQAIETFFSTYAGEEFPPRDHGVRFSNRGVSLIRQGIPFKVDGLKRMYLASVEQDT